MEGLDDLLKLLTRVKNNGWDHAFPENLYDNHSKETTRLPTSSRRLSTFLSAIEEARVCMKALDEARGRLVKRLHRLRRLSNPLVLEDGMNRLPDDVLAAVFETARRFIGKGPYQFALCVSHVSRRFRSVSLTTPLLWTTIRNSYGENQIREYISRSGRLDLDIILHCNSNTELFLKVLKDSSHRWSSFHMLNSHTMCIMMRLGISDFPRLRHLTYAYPVDLSIFSMPKLSQMQGSGWVSPAKGCLASHLTHVHVSFRSSNEEHDQGFGGLATTLRHMTNLRDLSFTLEDCTGWNIWNTYPSDIASYPKPRSVHIDRLAISILGEMKGEMRNYSALLFDNLMHLRPSTLELSIGNHDPGRFLFNSKKELFPYGTIIKFRVWQTIIVMKTLIDVLQSCEVVKTVHFDAPMGRGPQWCQLDNDHWERIRSLDHLRLRNCNQFSESEIEALATKILQPEAKKGIKTLEIISCKLISEDFLLGLHDEVGDGLKWTL